MAQTPLGWEGGLGSREAPGGRSPSASPPHPAAQPMESPGKRVGAGEGLSLSPMTGAQGLALWSAALARWSTSSRL